MLHTTDRQFGALQLHVPLAQSLSGGFSSLELATVSWAKISQCKDLYLALCAYPLVSPSFSHFWIA